MLALDAVVGTHNPLSRSSVLEAGRIDAELEHFEVREAIVFELAHAQDWGPKRSDVVAAIVHWYHSLGGGWQHLEQLVTIRICRLPQ